jgi:hypothetical protein
MENLINELLATASKLDQLASNPRYTHEERAYLIRQETAVLRKTATELENSFL